MAAPYFDTWWMHQDPNQVYFICSTDWSLDVYGYDLPFAPLKYEDDFFTDFSNGYSPSYAVIGNNNILMYSGNDHDLAMNTTVDAIQSFNKIAIKSYVKKQLIYQGEDKEVDIYDIFNFGNETITYTIAENSNPDVVSAQLFGSYSLLLFPQAKGSSVISLEGNAEGTDENVTQDFEVFVCNKDELQETTYYLEDSPEQGQYPDNPNSFKHSLVDLDWTPIEVEETGKVTTVNLSLDWQSLQAPILGTLWISSPAGTDLLLYRPTDSNDKELHHLDFELTDFAGEDLNGSWAVYMKQAYGQGGHEVTNASITFNYVEETGSSAKNEIINTSQLNSNYPNPFNPETSISFTLASAEETEVAIYNLKGQKIKTLVNDKLTTGNHTITWNGTDDNNKNVASGIYFYRMKAGRYTSTKKMILMK